VGERERERGREIDVIEDLCMNGIITTIIVVVVVIIIITI